ncbi:MAG TPA: LPS export ABC transporter permease LptG [Verrucomicrobiae bacterium]|jgi:LPS export ABC transporter permease LptF/LPS export ABC transporter permease LptG|nr:LPS export ABC transporter permease LptG [Verrucomicrobiae bacterium]
MGRIIDRYVLRELVSPFTMGVGVFTFFLVIDRIYHLTELVITKGVPFFLVLALLGFTLPSFLALTLPMALLVAVLIVGGRLAADMEVTAFKASGVSPLRLLRPFLAAGVLVTLISGALSIWIAPMGNRMFQQQLLKILQSRAATGLKERIFSASFGQFTIYVQDISASQVALKGLLVSDERDPALSRVIVAKEGRLLTDEEQGRITLRFIDGQISEAEVDGRRSRFTDFSLYDMNLPLESPLSGSSQREKPERDLPLTALGPQARELAAQGQVVSAYYVEFHKRFALPVAAIVFVLVGFPLGIRSQARGGGGRGVALAASLAIVVSYYIVFTTLEGMSLRGRIPPWLGIWLPDAIFLAAGLALIAITTVGMPTGWVHRLWHLRDVVRTRLPARPLPWRGEVKTDPGRSRRRASTFIIDRYLLREYVKFLGIGLGVGAVLFLVVDLLQTLDRFLRIKPPFTYILQHFIFRLPGALYDGLPIVVLIATVFLFLSLTRAHELDALKAAGVSLYRVSVPILVFALMLSVAAGFFQETALPAINARAEEIDSVKIRGNLPRHLQKRNQLWYRSTETRFWRMQLLDPVERSIDQLLLLEVNQDFQLVSRLDAKRARWTPTGWELSQGFLRPVVKGTQMDSTPFERLVVKMPEDIQDFTKVQTAPEIMSFVELRAYVQKLQETGHQAGKYIVELYSKLSFPLVHLIMALVAIPFALISPRSGGRAVGIAIAIVISVGYWLVHYMALAFAKADLLPPFLAAWTANVVFAGLGAALFLRART